MNKAYLSVQALEDPRQIYVDSSRTNVQVTVRVPALSKKAPTDLVLHIWAKADQDRIMQTVKKDSYLFLAGTKLRHDVKSREFSLQGGSVYPVRPDEFGIVNEIVLSGRCIKDVDTSDARQFKTTENGFMIANQSMSVNTGKGQADLFNFYAINKADDNYKPAELICNFTRKGTGLTICGRLVTDSWVDRETKEQKTSTKIQISQLTLAPKPQATEIKPQANIAAGSQPQSLWSQPQQETNEPPIGEPWGSNTTGLPDLPTDDDAPF